MECILPIQWEMLKNTLLNLDRMIGMNSGVNDYSIVTHNSYSTSVPFGAGHFTKFKLTDQQFDIIDMSQNYIHLNVTFDLTFEHQRKSQTYVANVFQPAVWFFVGFKSGAQIIESYKVYSNGRLTACNQVKSNHIKNKAYNCQ